MVLKHVLTIFLMMSVIFSTGNPVVAQQKLIDTLNNYISPITSQLDNNFIELDAFGKKLKTTKIVGLGEATHGTKEFFLYNHKITQFLVVNHGFKKIIIEADFAGSQVMNDYILYGKGNVKHALGKMGYAIWMTQEFVDFVEWLKLYNTTKETENKVQFFGCDMQTPQYKAKLIYDFLEKSNQLTEVTRAGLNIFINYEGTHGIDKKEWENLQDALAMLEDVKIVSNDPNFNSLYQQYIETLKQCYLYLKESSGFKGSELRDKFMFENIKWIQKMNLEDKIVVWAHNEHIAETKSNMGTISFGNLLAKEFGSNYISIGYGFFEGQVRAYNPVMKKNGVWDIPPSNLSESTDFIFSQCKYENFFLDIELASESALLFTSLNQNKYSRSIGHVYYTEEQRNRNYIKNRLSGRYDFLLYFRKTSAAQVPLAWIN